MDQWMAAAFRQLIDTKSLWCRFYKSKQSTYSLNQQHDGFLQYVRQVQTLQVGGVLQR
jgi:hypothetical protein